MRSFPTPHLAPSLSPRTSCTLGPCLTLDLDMNSNFLDFNSFCSQNENNTCQYYTAQEFVSAFLKPTNDKHDEVHNNLNDNSNNIDNSNHSNNDKQNEDFSILHINSRSISKNVDSLETLLHSLNKFSFCVIWISETWLNKNSPDMFNIQYYEMIHADRKEGRGGGVALYIRKTLKYKLRKDIHFQGVEDIFVEIENKFGKNIIVGTLYRPPCNNTNDFVDNIDEALDKICGENKHCYLMGDYNINLANYDDSLQVNESASASSNNIDSNHNNTQNKDKLLNTFSSYALFPCINKPTRITATSATLIDNIFSNTLNKSNNSGILYHDVSHHLPVFTITAKLIFKTRHKPIEITYRKESVENVRALTEKLVKEEWQDIFAETNVNNAYEKFINKLTYYYEQNIPLVKQKHRKNQIRNPWITQGIFRSIQTRNKLFKSYVRNPTEQKNCHYKRYRNILSKLIRTSKKLHYSKVLNNAEGNLNSTWKVIN